MISFTSLTRSGSPLQLMPGIKWQRAYFQIFMIQKNQSNVHFTNGKSEIELVISKGTRKSMTNLLCIVQLSPKNMLSKVYAVLLEKVEADTKFQGQLKHYYTHNLLSISAFKSQSNIEWSHNIIQWEASMGKFPKLCKYRGITPTNNAFLYTKISLHSI